MQISNQSILAAAFSDVGSALNRRQRPDQFPAKTVTIEGQIIDDNDEKKRARKLERENLSAEQTRQDPKDNQLLENNQQQSISLPPDAQFETPGTSLLDRNGLEQRLKSSSELNNLTPEQKETGAEHSFPYTNRRSSNGLAGGALVIQKYLNNEPDDTYRPETPLFSRFI